MLKTSLLSLVSVLSIMAAVGHSRAWAGPQDFPDGPGKVTLESECGACHAPELVLSYRKSSDDWLALVQRMRSLGATLNDEQVMTVAAYLAKSWPDTDPPLPPFVFPHGDGKEILESHCTSCHAPDLVRAYGKDVDEWADLIFWHNSEGTNVSYDQVTLLATYLAANWPPRTRPSAAK